MDRMVESCVPPGFRFHPTDEELVGYYLRKKVASQKIDLDVIRDIDLYRIEPWDLKDACRIGYEEQPEWYFFSHKDKKYPMGTRTNRATSAGFWKATGRDKAVYDGGKLIGMRKTLVFYKGRAPNGQKTDWIMHEYRMESEENANAQEEGWVVCRAFKKRSAVQTKNTTIHGVKSVELSTEHRRANFLNQNFILKHEKGKEASEKHTDLLQTDAFLQLPELESPSQTPMKRPLHVSLGVERCRNGNTSGSKKFRDWRDLDRFVASQLSHGDQNHSECELGLLMLQGESTRC